MSWQRVSARCHKDTSAGVLNPIIYTRLSSAIFLLMFSILLNCKYYAVYVFLSQDQVFVLSLWLNNIKTGTFLNSWNFKHSGTSKNVKETFLLHWLWLQISAPARDVSIYFQDIVELLQGSCMSIIIVMTEHFQNVELNAVHQTCCCFLHHAFSLFPRNYYWVRINI